jgi:hypothetical protein
MIRRVPTCAFKEHVAYLQIYLFELLCIYFHFWRQLATSGARTSAPPTVPSRLALTTLDPVCATWASARYTHTTHTTHTHTHTTHTQHTHVHSETRHIPPRCFYESLGLHAVRGGVGRLPRDLGR